MRLGAKSLSCKICLHQSFVLNLKPDKEPFRCFFGRLLHTKDDGFQTLLVSGSNLRSAISNWYFRDIQFHGVSILEEPNENPTCWSEIVQGQDTLHV